MSTLRLTPALLALLGLLSSTAAADTILEIGAEDIVWDPATTPDSPTNTVSIFRTSPDPQEDLLISWQLTLTIQADPGATGGLSFDGATLPTSNYPLEGVSGGLILNISPSGDELFAFDDDDRFPVTGVPISTTPQNLLDLTFSALAGTRGVFRILAEPGVSSTSWADDSFADLPFANVPFESGAIEIGSVTVPEPASAGVAALLALAACGLTRRRSRD